MNIFKLFIFLLTCVCDNDLDTKDDSKTQLITEQPKLKIGKNLKNAKNYEAKSKRCNHTLSDCYEYCYCCGFLCLFHITNCFCCCRKCYQDK